MPAFARGLGFSYLSPIKFCPKDGPQSLQYDEVNGDEDVGFCAHWALWYLHLRLEYPDVPPQELIQRAIISLQKQGGRRPLHNFIRDYARFFEQFRSRLEASPEDIEALASQFVQARRI